MRLFELRKTKEELAAARQAKQQAEYEIWKSPQAVHDRAYDALERLKEEGTKLRVLNNLQMFVPRGSKTLRTKKDRENSLLGNAYAWDDEGRLIKQYQDWVNQATESKDNFNGILTEGAPILADAPVLPGSDKPSGAAIWTSSAELMKDKSYASNWSRLINSNYTSSNWYSPKGYLYKIKPGTCLLELGYDGDAVGIYNIFKELQRGNNAIDDPNRWTTGYTDDANIIHRDFPWQEIAKHFDGVWHSGSWREDGFLRGWECESVAWFKASRLTLLGQCNVSKAGMRSLYGDDDED